jgi:hypothetical protein
MLSLPVIPSVPHYDFTTVIEDRTYLFEFRWNDRDSAWYMSVFEQDNTPIISGVKVVLGVGLGRRSNHPLFFDGVFRAVDTSGLLVDPTLDDLGTRVEIRYLTGFDLMNELVTANVANG